MTNMVVLYQVVIVRNFYLISEVILCSLALNNLNLIILQMEKSDLDKKQEKLQKIIIFIVSPIIIILAILTGLKII